MRVVFQIWFPLALDIGTNKFEIKFGFLRSLLKIGFGFVRGRTPSEKEKGWEPFFFSEGPERPCTKFSTNFGYRRNEEASGYWQSVLSVSCSKTLAMV